MAEKIPPMGVNLAPPSPEGASCGHLFFDFIKKIPPMEVDFIKKIPPMRVFLDLEVEVKVIFSPKGIYF